MKKLHKGFTLVELIVVIAIIGILAAILVPALVGYIKDAKLSSANSSAKTVYTAVNTVAEKCLIAGTPILTTSANSSYKITLSNCGTVEMPSGDEYNLSSGTNAKGSAEDIIGRAIASTLNADADGSCVRVVINASGFPSAVAWAKTDKDTYIGTYPTPATDSVSGGIDSFKFDASVYN